MRLSPEEEKLIRGLRPNIARSLWAALLLIGSLTLSIVSMRQAHEFISLISPDRLAPELICVLKAEGCALMAIVMLIIGMNIFGALIGNRSLNQLVLRLVERVGELERKIGK
jgi:hypothetical protein